MIIQCPQCRKSYKLDDQYRGRKGLTVKCPSCQTRFALDDVLPPEPPPQATPPPVEAPATPEIRQPAGSGTKILVADDSSYFRMMVGDILSAEGFQVIHAEDGEQALAKIRDEAPALVILDLHLPKISGFDVIKHVRHGHVRQKIPILVMSSVYTGTSHVMALETLGANDFIDKKFKPSYLIGRVKKLLEEK